MSDGQQASVLILAFLVVYAMIDGATDVMEFVIAAVIAVVGVGVLLEPDAARPPARGIAGVGTKAEIPGTVMRIASASMAEIDLT